MEELFQLIEAHIADAHFTGPTSDASIDQAEKLLGVVFSPGYKEFLKRFGAGHLYAVEVFGIVNDTPDSEPLTPNAIGITLKLRSKYGLPPTYIAVGDTGYGEYYVLEASTDTRDIELPVRLWSPAGIGEVDAPSFASYLYERLANMIEYQ
ncbi:MAG: SMI1/KNR4 family protein [Bacteroidetes bacterium]|nr:SMI1/KNR4 family protein [Bacteroidota bacterium]